MPAGLPHVQGLSLVLGTQPGSREIDSLSLDKVAAAQMRLLGSMPLELAAEIWAAWIGARLPGTGVRILPKCQILVPCPSLGCSANGVASSAPTPFCLPHPPQLPGLVELSWPYLCATGPANRHLCTLLRSHYKYVLFCVCDNTGPRDPRHCFNYAPKSLYEGWNLQWYYLILAIKSTLNIWNYWM